MKLRICLLFVICSVLSFRIYAQKLNNEEAMSVISKINTEAERLKSLKCDFVQKKIMKMLKGEMVSSGEMCFMQPSNLKWEYKKPFSYSFNIVGDNVVIKSNSRKDVIDVNKNKVFQQIASIMVNCVTGKCLSDNKQFTSEIYKVKEGWLVELTPQKKEFKMVFSKINVTFDKEKNIIVKVEMNEKSGDRTIIEFQNITKNVPLKDSDFAA